MSMWVLLGINVSERNTPPKSLEDLLKIYGHKGKKETHNKSD